MWFVLRMNIVNKEVGPLWGPFDSPADAVKFTENAYPKELFKEAKWDDIQYIVDNNIICTIIKNHFRETKEKLMLRCKDCKKKFPSHLLHEMFISTPKGESGYILLCPICALKTRNAIAGLPLDTPFDGQIAKSMYEEALEYIKEKK